MPDVIAVVDVGAIASDQWELSRAQIESIVTPENLRMPLGVAPRTV